MKKTQYFEYTRKRPDRAQIKDKWIKYVIDNPERIQIQSDGRIRKWAKITEANKHKNINSSK
jgi:hypothetical protein